LQRNRGRNINGKRGKKGKEHGKMEMVAGHLATAASYNFIVPWGV
jgi:hypothetical protein